MTDDLTKDELALILEAIRYQGFPMRETLVRLINQLERVTAERDTYRSANDQGVARGGQPAPLV